MGAYPGLLSLTQMHECRGHTHTHICTLSQQINWTGQRRSHLQLNLYSYVKQSKQQIRRHDEVEQSDNEYVT